MLLIFIIFFCPILARAALYAMSDAPRSYRDADWSSTGMLPVAGDDKPARVIIFSGTTGAWKGIFSVHSWVVFKRSMRPAWTRYDVVGWGNPLRVNNWPADGRWYGNAPVIIADVSGAEAEAADPQDRGGREGLRLCAAGRLSHLPGSQQQLVHRRGACGPCRNWASRYRPTRSAAISATASMPGLTDSGTGV